MDISLEELIKKNKLQKKQKTGQQQRQQKQQQQQQRKPIGVSGGRVGDVRDKINRRRNLQLRNQDARQRIVQKKRQQIGDARQLLRSKPAPKPAPKPVDFVVPKKVIKNNLYRTPPPPKVTVEYDAPPPSRQMNRIIPVQVTQRQQARPIASGRHFEQQHQQQHQQQRQHQQRHQSPRPRETPTYRERSRSPPRRSSVTHQEPKVVQGYKVTIGNLHPDVTREDIYELFSSVGSVKKCVLMRPGDAEVVYPKKEDATAAVRRYHRRELDGMPMKLSISTVGIKVSGGGGGGGLSVDDEAVRAALFRPDGGRRGRPVNFQVAV